MKNTLNQWENQLEDSKIGYNSRQQKEASEFRAMLKCY